MPCYHPLHGWKAPNGGIVFRREKSIGQEMAVPCGQCIGCRLGRSREWAIRCHHEIKYHEQEFDQPSTFATLTYRPENLPSYGTLVPHHFTDFMKRLRRDIYPKKVRYFQCGEYGEKFERPHHHAILFGYRDYDEEPAGYSNYEPIFFSPYLTKLWSHGDVITGTATFESAAYVARYITKKVNGEKAKDHYERTDPHTLETYSLHPEYATMSRSPGIGANHIQTYMSDVFPSDEVVYQGRVFKPPRFYSNRLKDMDPDTELAVRKKRKRLAARHAHDQTVERLQQREKVKKAQFNQLKRGYENET